MIFNFNRIVALFFLLISSLTFAEQYPKLTQGSADIELMKQAIKEKGLFQDAFTQLKNKVDIELEQPIEVPIPKDAGGGYTHEKHKKNYAVIYNAGILYQLTGEVKYANYVRDLLLGYSKIYRDLPLHPEKKEQAPGKLFWQSLNEAVWLVHAIQGYDNIIVSLSEETRKTIDDNVFHPMVKFLSVESAHTFNLVHNHGTWATAAVGMAGYVLNQPEWVEQALYGLDKSGKGGFMKQLDILFSPGGYYTEGPYYQRYALLPFVMFAKSIEQNEPNRKIFAYRDQVLLKAIDTTIQLSYNKLFFPINDAIKDKGIDTNELVHGVAIAYGLTNNTGLLAIAKQQQQILLTGDGLKVAQALDAKKDTPYEFKSLAISDGANGDEGSLIIMRANQTTSHQALVFKATSQGMGHGHFDKLHWLFYDNGQEIIRDYGAARFLNVEAKYGGHYLKENDSYAKQSIAHNTLVVDEKSHFSGKVKVANQHAPQVLFFAENEQVVIASASIDTAYQGVKFTRTQALVNSSLIARPLVIDVLNVTSDKFHQFDLPVHYNGHLMDTNFAINTNTTSLPALGESDGYQHLWLKGQGQSEQPLAKVTWLNAGRFYTHSTINNNNMQVLFTQIGANDPNFNLRSENAFVLRVPQAKQHQYVSVLELHGEYNPSKEFTVNSHSQLISLTQEQQGDVTVINVSFKNNKRLILAFVLDKNETLEHKFNYQQQVHSFKGPFSLIEVEDLIEIKE